MDLHPLATFHRQACPPDASNGSTGDNPATIPPGRELHAATKGSTPHSKESMFDHDRPDADGIDPDDDDEDDLSVMSLANGTDWPPSRFH